MQHFGVSSRKTSDQRAFATDNCQRASGRFTVGCSSLAIRQHRQCIWPYRDQVQQFEHQLSVIWSRWGWMQQRSDIKTTASAFDDIDIRCSPDYLSTDNFVSASDCIAVGCSISDIKINSLSVYSLIAASHSFDHFFTLSGTVDRPSYTFIL